MPILHLGMHKEMAFVYDMFALQTCMLAKPAIITDWLFFRESIIGITWYRKEWEHFISTEREGAGSLFQLIFSMDLVVVFWHVCHPSLGLKCPGTKKSIISSQIIRQPNLAQAPVYVPVPSATLFCNDSVIGSGHLGKHLLQCKCQHLFDYWSFHFLWLSCPVRILS